MNTYSVNIKVKKPTDNGPLHDSRDGEIKLHLKGLSKHRYNELLTYFRTLGHN